MPELPEVETVRRGLAELVSGRQVVGVEERGERTVRRQGRGHLTKRLEGRVILAENPTATAAADERFQNAMTLGTSRRQPALVARAERERRQLIPV